MVSWEFWAIDVGSRRPCWPTQLAEHWEQLAAEEVQIAGQTKAQAAGQLAGSEL